ncbi:MAG: class I SAM-dependent methyltransferase [Gemmataceae bacterium]
MSVIQDKAGQSYWDQVWQGQSIPPPIRPKRWSLRGHVYWTYHRMFVRAFQGRDTKGQTLLEAGCGHSRWLPYFAQQFGFQVSGIDYSPTGAAQARSILEAASVPGQIVESNFFTPPSELVGAFDVVVSFGVVEHFADTAATVAAFARFLRPGGLLITEMPNMAGWLGGLQKLVDPAVAEHYYRLTFNDLLQAHLQAGLEVQSCEYLLGVHWGVIAALRWRKSFFYPVIRILPHALSAPFWLLEWVKLGIPRNRWTSPYVVCLARKPQEHRPDTRDNLA